MEWISVEDRLPEVIGNRIPSSIGCLVVVRKFAKKSGVRYMEYVSDMFKGEITSRWKWDSINAPYEVTHWMPLPEPPKE